MQQELQELMNRINNDINLLDDVIQNRGTYFDEDYADNVIRAELNQIEEHVENMRTVVGEGDTESVTKLPHDR